MSTFFPKYDPDLFHEVHQVSTFLPAEENRESLECILYVIGAITVLHLVLLQAVKSWKRYGEANEKTADETRAASLAAWKASYQMTNLLVNFTLGCLGIFYQTHIPWLGSESIMNKIVGYEHVKLFAIGQVGYQLWALPIGIFFVGETKAMIIHHLAVICVGSVSTFVHSGFRYYTPYFYGLIEISSVPLSIMNAFKNNKHWIKAYPEMYNTVRVIFAVSFLVVRVVLWTPFYWNFWWICTMLLYSSDVTSTKIMLSLFNLSSLILTMLQYFWASKIISALVSGAPKKKEE